MSEVQNSESVEVETPVKAYDLKVLGARLKAKGLIEAEDAAGSIYSELKVWIEESAVISKTPYDNMALIIFPQLDNLILPQIDKIDGEES